MGGEMVMEQNNKEKIYIIFQIEKQRFIGVKGFAQEHWLLRAKAGLDSKSFQIPKPTFMKKILRYLESKFFKQR